MAFPIEKGRNSGPRPVGGHITGLATLEQKTGARVGPFHQSPGLPERERLGLLLSAGHPSGGLGIRQASHDGCFTIQALTRW